MFKNFAKWASFERPAYHAEARARDMGLLEKSVEGIDATFAMAILNGWSEHYLALDTKQRFHAFVGTLQQRLERHVAAWVVDRLSQAEGLADIQSKDRRTACYELLNPNSVLYTDAKLRDAFDKVAGSAKFSRDVHVNFVQMIGLLGYNAFGGGGSVDITTSRAMLANHVLLHEIWMAATARAMQPRYAGSLRDFRASALKAGVDGGVVPVPKWLEELEKTFFVKQTPP